MFGKAGLGGLMKQAQQMQENMKKAQEELGNIEVMGEAGAGLVKITMSCHHVVKRVDLDKTLLYIWVFHIDKNKSDPCCTYS